MSGDAHVRFWESAGVQFPRATHLPIYRQQDMFAGTGWTPSRSTMLNILTQCHFIVEPLLGYFKQVVLTDSIVACDDTGVTLLYPKVPPEFDLSDPKQKRIAEVFADALQNDKPSINAKMWAYRGRTVKLNVFDFTVSRHRDGPELFFENYHGTILGDCWHGFGSIAAASDGGIVRAACNSHARRKFEDATDYPADRRKWMNWFQELFDIETRGKVLSDEERLLLRQSESRAIWDLMRTELDTIDDRTEQVVLPKSELRKALNYLRNHWTELTRYLDDPKLPMGRVERWRGGLGFGLLPCQGFPVRGAMSACHAPFPHSRSSNRTCGATASGSLTKLRPSHSAWRGVSRAA